MSNNENKKPNPLTDHLFSPDLLESMPPTGFPVLDPKKSYTRKRHPWPSTVYKCVSEIPENPMGKDRPTTHMLCSGCSNIGQMQTNPALSRGSEEEYGLNWLPISEFNIRTRTTKKGLYHFPNNLCRSCSSARSKERYRSKAGRVDDAKRKEYRTQERVRQKQIEDASRRYRGRVHERVLYIITLTNEDTGEIRYYIGQTKNMYNRVTSHRTAYKAGKYQLGEHYMAGFKSIKYRPLLGYKTEYSAIKDWRDMVGEQLINYQCGSRKHIYQGYAREEIAEIFHHIPKHAKPVQKEI